MILSNILVGDHSLWGRGHAWTKRRATPQPRWLAGTEDRTSATAQPGQAEKTSAADNQRQRLLLVASSAAAISWTGVHFFFPPLQLVSVPITLAAALPIFRDTVTALRTGQMDVAAVSAVAVIGSLLLQQTTLAALIDVAHYGGQAAIEWRQNQEAAQTARTTAQSLYADSDIYLVHCWQENSGVGQQSVMRYVLEVPGDAVRHGFTQLADLIDTLRDKMAASQETSMPVAVLAN